MAPIPFWLVGSPPHTREPPCDDRAKKPSGGITPAYAGTTVRGLPARKSRQDHPRIRGNHIETPLSTMVEAGSPPHTREPLILIVLVIGLFRITPAYAGTTYVEKCYLIRYKDHPRIRGNHYISAECIIAIIGSPPHTREPPKELTHKERVQRITPAYAGTTATLLINNQSARDHPRIRGNHRNFGANNYDILGSPPHTREPPQIQRRARRRYRITPAYAGTTRRINNALSDLQDHPRIRGNHKLSESELNNLTVDHPRIRGNHIR